MWTVCVDNPSIVQGAELTMIPGKQVAGEPLEPLTSSAQLIIVFSSNSRMPAAVRDVTGQQAVMILEDGTAWNIRQWQTADGAWSGPTTNGMGLHQWIVDSKAP